MIGLYIAIYVVSPWGPDLYGGTFERLVMPVFGPAIVILSLLLAGGLESLNLVKKRAAIIAVAALLAVYGVSVWQLNNETVVGLWGRSRSKQFGLQRYLRDPYWQIAIAIDGQLPPKARGAALGEAASFALRWNYLIYPRFVYPAPSATIAFTTRSWQPYVRLTDVDYKKENLTFAFTGAETIIRLPQ